jgi:hypothetical protein
VSAMRAPAAHTRCRATHQDSVCTPSSPPAGWAIGRENASGTCGDSGPTGPGDSCTVIADPKLFPSGMGNVSKDVARAHRKPTHGLDA